MTSFIDEIEQEMKENKQTSYSKEEYAQMKKAEREKAFKMARETAELLPLDGGRFRNCLDLMSRFGRYSVSNILLLEAQKPDAKRLADFETWKDQKISINKGETGIMILEPGKEYTRKDGSTAVSYNVKKVFDVSQTNLTFAVAPAVKRDGRLLVRALIHNAPCDFENVDAGKLQNGRSAYYVAEVNKIYAGPGKDIPRLFLDLTAAIAEAHLSKGDFGAENKFAKAVCVAYILARRNDLDVSTFDFGVKPAMLRNMNSQQIRDFLSDVREVANTITRDMDRYFEKLKGVPEKDEAR